MKLKLTILLWVLGSVAFGQILERSLPLKLKQRKSGDIPLSPNQSQAVLTLPFGRFLYFRLNTQHRQMGQFRECENQ